MISEQGYAGTGLSTKTQNVFDISRPQFLPVLSYLEEGYEAPYPDGITRDVHGFLANFEKGRRDVIKIHYSVRFSTTQAGHDLGRKQADAVYARTGTGDFHFQSRLSSATRKEIEKIYEGYDQDGMTDDEFIHYNFANLKRIASGPRTAATTWLKGYLQRQGKSTERDELLKLAAQ